MRAEQRVLTLYRRNFFRPVRISQETHYVYATKHNRLMLFRETVAVFCEIHTEHTNTLCEYNVEFCDVKAGGKKGKTVPVSGRGVPEGCEMSRLPHFLDNPLTDGGEVVRLTHRPPFTHRKIPGTHFC
jgi:hypothetical protein